MEMSMPRYITHSSERVKKRLTCSLDDSLEVNDDSLPHVSVLMIPPDGDTHRTVARFREELLEDDVLFCELVFMPAASFVCGELHHFGGGGV